MSHRKNILSLLKNYQPAETDEIAFKDKMIAFANAHSDCFERSNKKGHFTASCWLLSKDGNAALLMHHMKLDRWFQLGGHADGDSNLLDVAIKEAQEESGIQGVEAVSEKIFDVDVHEIPANKQDEAHYHYDVRFLLRVASDEDFILNEESKELRWIAKDPIELPTRERSVTRMFEKWIALG